MTDRFTEDLNAEQDALDASRKHVGLCERKLAKAIKDLTKEGHDPLNRVDYWSMQLRDAKEIVEMQEDG